MSNIPGAGIINGAIGLNSFSRSIGGPSSSKLDYPGAISHITSAEKVDQRADANRDNRQRAGAGVGQGNRAESGFLSEKPLFDRAAQTLYPQEEDKPQLGVGVSQGVLKVRRAP